MIWRSLLFVVFYALNMFVWAGLPVAGSADQQPPPGVKVAPEVFHAWKTALEESAWQPGPYLNALALEHSPYLLQHAGNPVNWAAWSESTLEFAAKNERLIFLSIGYSTCHWCHVMNRESFTDPNIARLINENFTPIKVDREELPAVDHYYAGVLALVKGSAGWPLTAILDSAGRPIFIDAYLSPRDLESLLQRVVRLDETQPEMLEQSARMLAAVSAPQQLAGADESKPISIEELAELTTRVLGRTDPVHGGLRGAQKFPNEAMLLFLSAMRERQLDPGLGSAINRQLTAMATGGIYDHVNGGFFRYATDSTWTVPHYEKMLYNQALMLRSYSEAFSASGNALYRWVLGDLERFLSVWMLRQEGGFASAISADSGESEGGYYLWNSEQLEALPAGIKEGAGFSPYNGPGKTGLQGLMLANPDSADAQEIRRVLRSQAAARDRPFVDHKTIAAWNGALLSGLVAARRAIGSATGEEGHADLTLLGEYLWGSLYSASDRKLYRVSYPGGATVPAELEDYAYLTNGMLDLYDLTAQRLWIERAELLAAQLLQQFFRDGRFVSGNSRIPAQRAMRDGELPAADAVAVQALWRLFQRTGDERFAATIRAPVTALRDKFRAHPLSNLYAAGILAEVDLGSVAQLQYFAGGNGRLQVHYLREKGDVGTCDALQVEVALRPGWHVNSQAPLQDYLLPTRVRGEGILVSYPDPQVQQLGFEEEPLSLFAGEFNLRINPEEITDCDNWTSGKTLQFDLQACNDRVCMVPEVLTVLMPESVARDP